MNRHAAVVRIGIGLLVTLLLANSVYAADSQAGTWKLNFSKSKFNAGSAPKSQVTTIEAIQGGVRNVTNIVDAEGKSIHYEFSALYDGADYPVKGDPVRDMISIKKIDEYTFVITNKKAGKVVSTVRASYAPDGKTRTMTTTNTNGQTMTITVWDRQ